MCFHVCVNYDFLQQCFAVFLIEVFQALDMMEASTLSEEQKLQLRAYAAKMLHRDK